MHNLHGMMIGDFRNFKTGTFSPIFLTKVNAFIGSNNSGKSNVLRFVRDIVAPMSKLSAAHSVKDSGINRPFGSPSPDRFVWIAVPTDISSIQRAFQNINPDVAKAFSENLRQTPYSSNDRIFLPFLKSPSQRADLDMESLATLPLNEQTVYAVWRHTGRSGGGYHGHWLPDVMKILASASLQPIETVYIPAFRQLETRLDEFADEYRTHKDGSHVIDQLQEYFSPSWHQQDKKLIFEKLRRFIGTIIDNEYVKIEIPFDRKTINVNTDGYFLPLESFGAGIHELVMLASEILLQEGKVVLLEEPEVHLHPTFQKKFVKFLVEEVDAQFLLSTHSSAIIDSDHVSVFGVKPSEKGAEVLPLLRNQARRDVCNDLGYKASELLQSNFVIWVEGPSDRIYLNHWINAIDPSLTEGIEYSIVFYGGRLLSHLEASDESAGELINVMSVNRYGAILIDSDKGAETSELNATKIRLISQFEDLGMMAWVTAGREIESYIPNELRLRHMKAIKSEIEKLQGFNRFAKPLDYVTAAGEKKKFVDKMALAHRVAGEEANLDTLDLREQVEGLVKRIQMAN